MGIIIKGKTVFGPILNYINILLCGRKDTISLGGSDILTW